MDERLFAVGEPATVQVKVNPASLAGLLFHPCTDDFVADVCQGRCCRSTTDPTGIAVVVAPAEAVRLRQRGAQVDEATGRVQPVDRRCPFQGPAHGCGLHGTDDKPAGCTASPFTVNPNGTLIVRNRYKFLPCYRAVDAVPVTEAHPASLRLLFGDDGAAQVLEAVRSGRTEPMYLPVPADLIEVLRHKDQFSRPQKSS